MSSPVQLDTVVVHDTVLVGDTVRVVDTVLVQSSGPTAAHWLGLLLTVGLVATAVVAIVIEVRRDKRRDKERGEVEEERRRATHSLISAEAYAARRQLRLWLEDRDPETTGRYPNWAQEIKPLFDKAESHFLTLARLRPDAGVEVSRALGDSYVLFLRATDRINKAVTSGPTVTVNRDIDDKLRPARHELVDCVTSLSVAIEEDLRDR